MVKIKKTVIVADYVLVIVAPDAVAVVKTTVILNALDVKETAQQIALDHALAVLVGAILFVVAVAHVTAVAVIARIHVKRHVHIAHPNQVVGIAAAAEAVAMGAMEDVLKGVVMDAQGRVVVDAMDVLGAISHVLAVAAPVVVVRILLIRDMESLLYNVGIPM